MAQPYSMLQTVVWVNPYFQLLTRVTHISELCHFSNNLNNLFLLFIVHLFVTFFAFRRIGFRVRSYFWNLAPFGSKRAPPGDVARAKSAPMSLDDAASPHGAESDIIDGLVIVITVYFIHDWEWKQLLQNWAQQSLHSRPWNITFATIKMA